MNLTKKTLEDMFDVTAITTMRYVFNSGDVGATTYDRRGDLTKIALMCGSSRADDFIRMESAAGEMDVTAEVLFS